MRHRTFGLIALTMFVVCPLLATELRAESVRITASRLAVRKGPAKAQARIGAVQKGRVLEVLQRKGAWIKIRYGKRGGWIHGRYTRPATGKAPATASPADAKATHTVIPNRLNVRRAPGRKAGLRFRLRRGQRVAIQQTRGGWVQVTYRGRSGWTLARYLTTGKLPPRRRAAPRRRPRRRPARSNAR